MRRRTLPRLIVFAAAVAVIAMVACDDDTSLYDPREAGADGETAQVDGGGGADGVAPATDSGLSEHAPPLGTDCPIEAVPPMTAPATRSPRVLVIGPAQDATTIATHLRGMLDADPALSSPFVASSGNDAASLMTFFYDPTGRDARLAPLSQQWTHVVLIESALYASVATEVFFEGVRVLACRARAGGATPIVLMPWTSPSTTATATALGDVTYRVANGTFSPVVPAGFAKEAAEPIPTPMAPAAPAREPGPASPVMPTPARDLYVSAASLYSALTGNRAPAAYHAAGFTDDFASKLAAAALIAVDAESTKVHYVGTYRGPVEMRGVPSPGDFWFVSSGTSSEAIWQDRMNEIAVRAGFMPHGTALASTNDQKVFDDATLTVAAPTLAAHPYRILFARRYSVSAPAIVASGGPAELQVQVWDRHADSDTSDGSTAVKALQDNFVFTLGEAKAFGLAFIPYHLMFAKLKTMRPSVALLSDGTHATYPVGLGLATMSFVARTGLHVSTKGLDADATLAAQLGDETIRQLSSLSAAGSPVADDPTKRPSLAHP